MKRTPLKRRSPLKRSGARKPTFQESLAREMVHLEVRRRSWGVCEMCQDAPATNFHHRLRRSHGGGDTVENILHLCGSGTLGCHGYIHANPAWAYEHGALLRSGSDPATVDFVR